MTTQTVDLDLTAQMPGCRPGWTYADALALGERLARYKRNRKTAERAYYAERAARQQAA
jgi:hypothetical protein